MSETSQESYDRGELAGEIAARLAGHDRRFAAIDAALAVVTRELHALTLAVQRLGDQAVARDATIITTAAALKDADAARRDRTGIPLGRVGTVVGILAALVGAYFLLRPR